MIKYMFSLNYPLGKAEEYFAWVRSATDTFTKPPELRALRTYDNYFGAVPQRFVVFEFDDMESAARYWERPIIRRLRSEWAQHCETIHVSVLAQRYDYERGASDGPEPE